MYQAQKVRTGFVTIHRRPNGRFEFQGLNVMGRSKRGQLINRALWLHHKAPDWVRELCNEYADTNFKLEMRVDKLHDTDVALLVPTASSRQEAIDAYTQRYGRVPDGAGIHVQQESQELPPTAFDNAFKTHEWCATRFGLEVISHHKDGLKSYTKARNVAKGFTATIVGGMLVNKVCKDYSPETPLWQTAVQGFVRIKKDL